MNPFTATFNDINYLFRKRPRPCKYLLFKGNHAERSFIRNIFPNLAWILITAVILFPPELVPPRTTICAPWKDLISHYESLLRLA